MNHRNKILKFLPEELTCNYVAKAPMLIAVSVFQDIWSENVPGTKVIRAIGFVHRAVVAAVVLKGAVDVPISGENPSVVESVVVDRMVIA